MLIERLTVTVVEAKSVLSALTWSLGACSRHRPAEPGRVGAGGARPGRFHRPVPRTGARTHATRPSSRRLPGARSERAGGCRRRQGAAAARADAAPAPARAASSRRRRRARPTAARARAKVCARPVCAAAARGSAGLTTAHTCVSMPLPAATRTRPSSRLAAQQADDAEELEERGASPDMMETCVQMSVVLHGQFSGAWYIPRQGPVPELCASARVRAVFVRFCSPSRGVFARPPNARKERRFACRFARKMVGARWPAGLALLTCLCPVEAPSSASVSDLPACRKPLRFAAAASYTTATASSSPSGPRRRHAAHAEPLSKTLLEAFCNSHDIKDRSKVLPPQPAPRTPHARPSFSPSSHFPAARKHTCIPVPGRTCRCHLYTRM